MIAFDVNLQHGTMTRRAVEAVVTDRSLHLAHQIQWNKILKSSDRKEPSYFQFGTFKFAKFESRWGFCFGIEVVKNSEGACVFCTTRIRGAKPPL